MFDLTTAAAAASTTSPWILGAAVVGVLGAIFTALGIIIRFADRTSRNIGGFLEDWYGEPARPGTPERLGVPARLLAVEDATSAYALALAALTEQLALIVDAVGQLQPNGGTTLHDAIHRIERDTATVTGRPAPPPHR